MAQDQPNPPIFHLDVTSDSFEETPAPAFGSDDEMMELLRELVAGQQRQNQLLEDLTQQMGATQRQRATELGQWRQANPQLARDCRTAAEELSRVQTEFLKNLAEEVKENADCLYEGDFMLNEFVDRFGPRLAHLNGVLQVLSQLSSVPNPTNASQ